MMSLHVWLPGPMFLLGVSVQGGLCPGCSLSMGVSVKEGLCPGGLCQGDPLYSEEWVVCILLECVLVN